MPVAALPDGRDLSAERQWQREETDGRVGG
jgi:hypothetical protein